jgi:hypothetical protein
MTASKRRLPWLATAVIAIFAAAALVISPLVATADEPTPSTAPTPPPTSTPTVAPTAPPAPTPGPPPTPAVPTPAPSSGGQSASIAWLIAALIVVIILGVGAGLLLMQYRRRRADRSYTPRSAYMPASQANTPGAGSSAAQPASGLPGGELERVLAERGVLAAICMQLANAAREDPRQFAQIQQGLARAGYHVIDPTGERFDSRFHEALQTRPAPDPSLDGIIAATVRLGYYRDDRLECAPEVVVYRYQPTTGPRP